MAVEQFIFVTVGTEDYGIPLGQIRSIERIADIARVKRTPRYIEGVFELRGEEVPVVDLGKRFGLEPVDRENPESRIIVVALADATMGWLVDRVVDVKDIDSANITASSVVGQDAEHILGFAQVNDRVIVLLDAMGILSGKEISQLGKLNHELSAES